MKRLAGVMRALRKYLSWIFALTFLIGVPITFTTTVNLFGTFRQYDSQSHLSASRWLLVVLLPWIMPLQTAAFGIIWWTVFSEKRSARAWGIAASLVFIAWALLPLLIPPHFFWNGDVLILGVGIVGLLAFAWRVPPLGIARETQKNSKYPGDGTSSLFNNAVQLVMLLVGWRAYHWWLGWARNNDFLPPDFMSGTLTLALVGLLIAALHESGHTLVGLLVGMKLRAFIVGPFQWRIHKARWEFHFEPRQILATLGATGVVPVDPHFPRWAGLFVLTGGVFTNTITAVTALWLTFARIAPPQLQGVLALFGVFSLVMAAINLVPFRTGENYSDGAQIYQLLSNRAWADFQRIVGLAGSSVS